MASSDHATPATTDEFSSIRTFLESDDISILPQDRLKAPQTNLIPAICFYNGTFTPIHAGHVNAMEQAKQYINNLGTHELLATYISLSHSAYAMSKLNPTDYVGAGHRLSMVYLAIADMDWVMVDLFEIFQRRQTSLRMTMEAFASRVRSQLPNGSQIELFWLKGEDALEYASPCDHLIQLGFYSVYIVNRGIHQSAGNEVDEVVISQLYYEKRWKKLQALSKFPDKFHLVQAPHMNLSSSTIRACASNPTVTYEQLHACVQLEKVTKYILQHKLWSTQPFELPTLSAFPQDIRDFTAELFSEILSAHSNSIVKIDSFSSKEIGVGKGWNGSIYRLYNIQYSSENTVSFPSSFVLKLSTGCWMERTAMVEPEFYITLGPRIGNIELPKFYYAAHHPDSTEKSLMLLEDLSIHNDPLFVPNLQDDSTLFHLIASIAALHAECFERPFLKQEIFFWLPPLNSLTEHYHSRYKEKMNDEDFIEILKSKTTPKAYDYAQLLVTHIPHIIKRLTYENFTLSHGDFWVNNVFIRRDDSHRLVLLDWQTCARANGLIDVVFLLRLLDGDRARAIESSALKLYHQTLVKYGVLCYDLSEICEDYYSLALPFMFVIISSLKYLKESKLNKVVMMLEDIVIHGMNTKRYTCDCKLK